MNARTYDSTTMHMFTQLQQSTPTSFITCLHQQLNIIACMKVHQQHICTYTYLITNVTIIIQQLHINSHNSSKGKNTSYYDKHHIQHCSIIPTSSFNHIKLFISKVIGFKD